MTQPPEPTDPSVADAEAKLARLGVQAEAMQALLTRLLQDVVSAETRLDQNQAARLVEANEQLVLAALASQADAETAAKALQNAAQATVLDALTGLPNRTALRERFVQAIANAKRRGSRFALLFVDLDNFKELNDTHGHAFGDKVLCLAAKRMLAAVREVDTVSRHGGDEFLILLAELNQPRDARTVAEKLIAAVGAPAVLDGQAVSVTASVGITVYPDDGEDFDTLVARADAAMYESKRQRAGGIAFHGVGPVEEPAPQARPAAGKGADEAIDSDRWHAQLREANEKLVLAALTAQELQAAAEQARQRQAAFVAAVADELRNPLAPIRIASAMLGRAPTDEALLPRVQGMVEQQMTQMSRLVGDLIDASNVEAGALELERRLVD
ncbi:MAG TPA: diguanylate cyclase, partial [Rhodocyclaceae bacterium]|nr:diguanylate cyclase [Rhodocyclaceae bacterium]